jgi:hypothetical protein
MVGRAAVLVVALFIPNSAWTADPPRYTPHERVVFPSGKDNLEFVLALPAGAPTGAATIDALRDAGGKPISPQPTAKAENAANGEVQVQLTDVHFWGEARMAVGIGSSSYTYLVQRGLELAHTPGSGSGKADVTARLGTPLELWFYNPERTAVTAAWRLISDGDAVCGAESNGTPRRDCSADDRWSQTRFLPGTSGRIVLPIPEWWFHPWRPGADMREAAIELRYGSGEAAQVQRIVFQLGVATAWVDRIPRQFVSLIWSLWWVFTGAALLMLAQVLIPNWRKCLAMETQLDFLHERLRALTSRVGDRLYTRCEQEILSLRRALGMERSGRGRFRDPKFLLYANTAEVNRLAGALPRIDSRIQLTEQLDEAYSGLDEAERRELPATLCLERERQFSAVRGILSRQYITEAEEKAATRMLDDIEDMGKSLSAFSERLEERIAALRRRKADLCSATDPLLDDRCGCGKLLAPPPAGPAVAITTKELFWRDLCAIKLEIVFRTIELGPLLNANPAVAQAVRDKLRSDDPSELESANTMLSMLSEGVSEGDIVAAFAGGLWDAFYEPNTVTDQDVIRASFLLRRKTLNRCAAKDGFECWWHITVDGADRGYEHGWEVQFIASRGNLVVDPEIYDRSGKRVNIRSKEDAPEKGQLDETIGPPKSDGPFWRSLRGAADAVLTALVPVVTVAVTQGSGTLDIGKLILLGFTSQAIRAAIVPESTVATKTEPQPVTTAPQQPSKPDTPSAKSATTKG